MILDLFDLRRNEWTPRRREYISSPKTIDQIHEDVLKEREEQEKRLYSSSFRGPQLINRAPTRRFNGFQHGKNF